MSVTRGLKVQKKLINRAFLIQERYIKKVCILKKVFKGFIEYKVLRSTTKKLFISLFVLVNRLLNLQLFY